MKTISRAAVAQIDSIIRKLEWEKLHACTTATGLATAPSLAEATINGMWLFLGVQVDALSLRPQAVRLIELSFDDEPIHVLITDQVRRVLITSTKGREEVLDRLGRMQIEVEWTEEVGDVR